MIYDPAGNNGKSEFIKYMINKDPKRYFFLQGLGQLKDSIEAIKNALAKGWSGETLFINFPRQCADHKIYESLECFIDGMGTSQKYSGKSHEWLVNKVILFSNFMFNLSAMTYDRWDIRKIDNKTKLLVNLTYSDSLKIYHIEKSDRKT